MILYAPGIYNDIVEIDIASQMKSYSILTRFYSIT